MKFIIQTLLAIAILILVCCLPSCFGKKESKTETPKVGMEKIIAVYTLRDSTRVVDIMIRNITKQIKYDSALGKDLIVIDTIWGYPVDIALRDSTGKIVYEADGKTPKIDPVRQYRIIPKDSVNWHIENINVDSLTKKK